MLDDLTVLSWNVQGEIGISADRMDRQLEFLETYTEHVDLFLFQAVNYEQESGERWGGQLGRLYEYFFEADYHVAHTADWAQELADSTVQPHADITGAHNRCNLIASRWPIERRPLTLRNRGNRKPRRLNYYYTQFPEKILVAELDVTLDSSSTADNIEVWNVGIINGANWGEEKLNMLETVYGRIHLQTAKTETPVLLGGDFNAPKQETEDGTIIPHGRGTGQYTTYPDYGSPRYFCGEDGDLTEFEFSQRWQLSEARLFDQDLGEWGMTDVYWEAVDSPQASSTEDYTHVLPNGSPRRKRLDHILVSRHFDAQQCDLWNGERGSIDGFCASDHAPVVATLSFD